MSHQSQGEEIPRLREVLKRSAANYDESTTGHTHRQAPKPPRKRSRIAKPIVGGESSSTGIAARYSSTNTTPRAADDAIVRTSDKQRLEATTKPQHAQNEYLTDDAELATIHKIGCKMTSTQSSHIDDSAGLPEAIVRLEQLAKDISVSKANVDEELQEFQTSQRSVENMYDEVQTTHQKIMASIGTFLQNIAATTSKDLRKDMPREVEKWEAEMRSLLAAKGNQIMTGGGRQSLAARVGNENFSAGRFKGIQNAARQLKSLLLE